MGVLWSKMERVLSIEIQRNQLKPADHIYTGRPDHSKSHGILVCKDYVIHQADQGYRMLRTRIDNFLDGFLVPHLDENNGEDFGVCFKTRLVGIRFSSREDAACFLAVASTTFLGVITIYKPASLTQWAGTVVLTYMGCIVTYEMESRTPKELKELSFLPTLKDRIFFIYSVLFYLAFGIAECITLFCWSIYQRNFNFRNWLLLNNISVEQLNPGDHIYTWRGYAYTHHGIYVGNGKVIHAVRSGGPKTCSYSSSSSSPFYSPNIYVESIDINKFVSGGDLYLYEYGVNLGYFIAKFRGGSCTLASSDPPEDVLHRAKFLLRHKSREGKKGKKRSKCKVIVGAYDLLRSNCEDFAIYCKTSLAVIDIDWLGRSGQISCLVAVVGFLFSFTAPFLSTDLIRMFTGYCIYSALRIISDTKWLRGSDRIKVEDLADFEKLYGGISTRILIWLLKVVLLLTILLWTLRCSVFGGGTECHLYQDLQWIMVAIIILTLFL